uniref:Uncharacterized protein n=1 Tax=Arundo donax TaxID=35708 RepID=A0A0A9BMI1_ARUDO
MACARERPHLETR